MSIRVTYDKTVDAAYIYLTSEALPSGRESVPLYQDVPHAQFPGEYILDFRDKRLVGIEVLGASRALPVDLLEMAT
jgi:uncharacterized protein YuzE